MGEDVSSDEEQDHFPLKKLEQFLPMAVLNETCRDQKRLLAFLETSKANFETLYAALIELSEVVKREVRKRPTFTEVLHDLDAKLKDVGRWPEEALDSR